MFAAVNARAGEDSSDGRETAEAGLSRLTGDYEAALGLLRDGRSDEAQRAWRGRGAGAP